MTRIRSRRSAALMMLLAAVVTACGSGDATVAGAGDAAMADGAHSHDAMIEVDAATAPSVALEVSKDAVGGWNLHADVSGMALVPEAAGSQHVPGEGHMHVYVDGVKVGRVYTPWYHLGDLDPGTHEIEVTLNANSHAALAVDGVPIASSVTVEQPASDGGVHGHMDTSHEAETSMTVALRVAPDPVMGWNAFIETTGFTWAPQHASSEHIPGEGHAHLYVDGVKIARLYGEAHHFTLDEPGTHEVVVGLNGNDHAPFTWNGVPVEAAFEIVVEGEPETADETFAISVRDGSVAGPGRVEVATGRVIEIVVDSDQTDRVHVHGYDAYADVSAGAPAVVKLRADVPGVFEVELEGAGLPVLELVVR